MQSIPDDRAEGDDGGFVRSRAAPAVLVALAAAMATAASVRPLSHSELRYVQAGAEMAAGGDWVVPHLSYVPYFEKPILTYWLEAASQIAFGAGSIAVHLPSILAVAAMVWTTFALGRNLRGAAFGLGAGALLAASVVFQEMGTAVLTDAPFAAFLAFAWYAFRRHDLAPRSGWIWAFWTALGLAFLTKGPLALALVGSTVGAYLALAGRFRDCVSMRMVRGALIVVAINLPWSVLVWQRDPRFLEFYFVRQNFQALVDEKVNHAGPPWYYLRIVLPALFPFGVLGAWALCTETWNPLASVFGRLRARSAAAPDEGRLYVACMFVAPLLFLSVSASKLGTYVLPLFPAMALLGAAYVADHLASPTRMLRFATLVQGGALLAVAAAVPAVLDRLPERSANVVPVVKENAGTIWMAGALLVLPMLAGGVAMARGRVVAGMAVVAAGAFGCVLAANAIAPSFGGSQEAGVLVERMKSVRAAGERVVVAGPCADDYAIVMALGERPHFWGKVGELGMGHFTEVVPPPAPIPADVYEVSGDQQASWKSPWLLDVDSFRAAWREPGRMWFVGRAEKDVPWLRKNGFDVVEFAADGDTAIVTNHPLP